MPANRKRLAIWAPEDRWQLLGELLAERRRVSLGIATLVEFARRHLPPTPDGNPNRRRVDDLENNRRPNRWPEPTLKEMAAAYGVTYASMRAVLDGRADKLDPAPPVAPELLPSPPPSGLIRESAARPYFIPLYNRVLEWADRGTPEPTGAQLGLEPAHAKLWDDSRGAMSRGDRAWMVAWMMAESRRLREERHPSPANGATSA